MEAPVLPSAGGRLCDLLGCRYPVLQAGMGGVARSDLVAAVIEAGGYGFLGMVREDPALIRQEVEAVRQRSGRPFGVCLVPAATPKKLLMDQIQACGDLGVDSLSFFWTVDEQAMLFARAQGLRVIYQVGTVAEAIRAEQSGAVAVVVQGVDAGGHVHGSAPALMLLDEVRKYVRIPVAVSGGFATRLAVAEGLSRGADGVMVGTAFVATHESFAHDYHKRRLCEAPQGSTVMTDLFCINWPARSPVRVLENSLTRAALTLWGHDASKLPREPIGRQGGRSIFRYSTDSPLRDTTGSLEQMALYAGTGVADVNAIVPAGALVRHLAGAADASVSPPSRTASPPCPQIQGVEP